MQQKNRPRLGRGLSSLIPSLDSAEEREVVDIATPPAGSADGAVSLPVEAIAPNPHQPRRTWDEARLSELAASIRTTGLIQPVLVRPLDGGYQLIAGERRLRAARLAGLTHIPALVREVDALTQAQMALIENVQREDLNPVDRAQAYRSLMDQLGLTQQELADRLGEDRSSIANYLRVLDLTEKVRQLVRDGRLSLGHAKIIAAVSDILEQERLANLVVAQELSVRNLERLMQNSPPAAATRTSSATPHLLDLEKNISRQLGMRVQVRAGRSKGKGRLVIHYASLDQFDELMSKLSIQIDD